MKPTKNPNLIYDEIGQFPDMEKLNKLYNEIKPGLKSDFFMISFTEPMYPQVGRQYLMDDITYIYTPRGYTREEPGYPYWSRLHEAKKWQEEKDKDAQEAYDSIELDKNLEQLTTISIGAVSIALCCTIMSGLALYGFYTLIKLIF